MPGKSQILRSGMPPRRAYSEVAETIKYLEIRAPFAGVISLRNVNPGAYVGPSGKGSELPLFTLQEQKHMRLVISVPEAYTGYLTDNDKVNFTVKALPNRVFTAQVRRLAGALDNHLRAERTEMDVYSNDKTLLPGMVAEVETAAAGEGQFIYRSEYGDRQWDGAAFRDPGDG